MRGAYLGVHVRHESGADLAGLSLADIHLLDVQLVRLLVLIRLDHLADAHVDELLDALGGLGGLVCHRANGDARGGRARGAARRRAQGRGGGEGVHGAEGESHREWSVACATTSVERYPTPPFHEVSDLSGRKKTCREKRFSRRVARLASDSKGVCFLSRAKAAPVESLSPQHPMKLNQLFTGGASVSIR
jgi:hypothetical protein